MGKSGAVHQTELDRLTDERIDLTAQKQKIRRQVEAEFREKIETEIEYRIRSAERAFAVRFVELKEAGATWNELVQVLGKGTAAEMRRIIELGGGTVNRTKTSDERRIERGQNLGVREIGHNRFIYTAADGQEIESYLLWNSGKPALWADGMDVKILLAELGGNSGLRKRGEEIAAAFNITNEEENND